MRAHDSRARTAPDGRLDQGTFADIETEPRDGDYLPLGDGRLVRVLGHAREPDGRLAYVVVADPSAK